MRVILFLLCVLVFTTSTRAQTLSYDSPTDPAYANGWTTGTAGGFGWGSGWNIKASSNGAGSIATLNGTTCFKLSAAGQSPFSSAYRPFATGMTSPETLSFNFYSTVSTGSFSIVQDQAAHGLGSGYATGLSFAPGSSGDYVSSGVDTGVPITSSGVNVTMTPLISAGHWTETITPLSNPAQAKTISILVSALPHYDGVYLQDSGASSPNSIFDLNVGDISVVASPEPTSIVLLGIGASGVILRRRR